MVVWHVNTKFLCQTRKANVQKSISRLNLCSKYKYIWLLFISELLDNFPFLNTFVTQETILIYILTMWILFFQSSIEFSLSSMHCVFISLKRAHWRFCELSELHSEHSVRSKKENISADVVSRVGWKHFLK